MDGVQFSTKNNCAVIVRFWHETDMLTALRNVRYQSNSGKHVLALSFSGFDPSGHRLGRLVIAPITTIKILTVAPELRSGRAWVRSKRLVIWKNDGLLRL